MKKFLPAIAALYAATAIPTVASAATFGCTSKNNHVGQSRNGELYMMTEFGVFTMCNLTQPVSSVSPDTCRAWYTSALTARGLNKNVDFYFDTAEPANADMVAPYCTTTSNFNWRLRIPDNVYFRFDQP